MRRRARAKRGDAKAYEALVRAHASFAYNLALRTLGDEVEAEDAAQEAFVRAWRGLPRFRDEARFRTWLYRIVVNQCYDRMPKLKRQLEALEVEAATGIADDDQDVESVPLTHETRGRTGLSRSRRGRAWRSRPRLSPTLPKCGQGTSPPAFRRY